MSFPLTDGMAVRRFPFCRMATVFLLLGMLCALTLEVTAQAPYFRWAKRIPGAADDVSNAIAVDGGGNNYITGYYKSTSATFGATALTNAGGAEVFVTKYDYAGNALWARRAGGTAEDVGNGIAVDGSGNVYVTGYYLSTNINFSGTVLTNAGSAEIFVAKYNSAGTLLWAKAAGGSGYDAANAIAVDAAGNAYITGFFYSSTANFGNVTITNSGQDNIFVAKYDASGNLIWAKQAGGTSFDLGMGIAADASGNSYITGYFFSPTNAFGAGITLVNSGLNDVFLAKYDSNGNPVWARLVRGAADDFAYGVDLDGAGSPYITGTFRSPVATFGPGITLTNGGAQDVFLAKYDTAGTALWARRAGGSSDDYSYGITVDATTNVFITGNFFSSTATFGGTTLSNIAGHDIFAARYTGAGNLVWVKQAGGSGLESANAVGADAGGNSYYSGYFATGNPGFSGIIITNSGGKDIFLAQLDGDPPLLDIDNNGNSAILSWPTNKFGFKLEAATNIPASSAWVTITNVPTIVGTQFQVTNNSSGNFFYRLHR